MGQPPDFLTETPQEFEAAAYQPSLPSRRGELLAWLSALGVAIGTALLALRLGQLPTLGLGLTLFLVLVAVIISFGVWMDRNTRLEVNEDGLHYRSPVRDVELSWAQVKQLEATPAGEGWRIRVYGDEAYFSYRTASMLRFGSFSEMPLGFSEGERVAAVIRSRAALSDVARTENGWRCRRPEARGPS